MNTPHTPPSEDLRNLNQKDRGDKAVISHVMEGLEDVKQGCFSEMSILDILKED